jgi:hypothetical protein
MGGDWAGIQSVLCKKIFMERTVKTEENNIKINIEQIGCRDVN